MTFTGKVTNFWILCCCGSLPWTYRGSEKPCYQEPSAPSPFSSVPPSLHLRPPAPFWLRRQKKTSKCLVLYSYCVCDLQATGVHREIKITLTSRKSSEHLVSSEINFFFFFIIYHCCKYWIIPKFCVSYKLSNHFHHYPQTTSCSTHQHKQQHCLACSRKALFV